MKILVLDIETAPNTAHVWALFKQNIGINQLLDTGRVMCFSARWLGSKELIFHSEIKDGHAATINAAHALLAEADAVLSFNGERFDLPTLNREFLKYGLPPPAPYHSIDLYKVAKRRFRFVSNKMDHLAKELGLPCKIRHEGHEMWIKCMNGDLKAWKRMEAYNKRDVKVLEGIYGKMVGWIDTHPNKALYATKAITAPTCTNCGSLHVHSRGEQRNKAHAYIRYQCADCGVWMRSRYTSTAKNANILTQIGG
jgi:predicted RNA-binding Zn-ribbon protein involved in translation (DUF1610 family)